MKITITFITILITFLNYYSQPSGYAYGKQLLINGTQVSGSTDLIDFPMLVSFTDPDLRSVANGGNVQSSNGYDIIFTLADCGATILHHQIEEYDPFTGTLVAWVKVNNLKASSNTNIHMYYGNSSITTNPSSTSTWHSEVRAVYHLSNNDFTDGTSNGMNGTNNSTGNIAGKIGNARSFSGTNQYIRVPESGTTSLDVTTLTMSAWIYPTSFANSSSHNMILNKEDVYEMGLKHNSGELQAAARPSCWRWYNTGGSISPALNTWSHVVIVVSGGEQKNYINGVHTETFNDCSNPMSVNNEDLRIGARKAPTYPSYFTGNIDEVKIVGREETADWIATEYNNQNNPSAFYTKSSQMTAHNLCVVLPIELNFFKANINNNDEVLIQWETLSEINNKYFEIQRSHNAVDWEIVDVIKGKLNSTNTIKYSHIDYFPLEGTSYYRLKQIDNNGEFSYSKIDVVKNKESNNITVYPNPAKDIVTILGVNKNSKVRILNYLGVEVLLSIEKKNDELFVNTESLEKGLYLVEILEKGSSKIIKLIKE